MTRRALPSDPLTLLREVEEVVPPPGAATRIAARLSTLAGGAAGTAAVASLAPAAGAAWKVLGLRFLRWSVAPLGVGILLGAGGQALMTNHGPPQRLRPQPALPAPSSLGRVVVTPSLATAIAPTSSAVPEGSGGAPKAASPRSAVNTLVEERMLLDKARRELASGEAARSLTFLQQHALRFARGELVEEREAMWINVLVRLGRKEEAKARGEAFQTRFPKSLMGSSVRAALSAADASP